MNRPSFQLAASRTVSEQRLRSIAFTLSTICEVRKFKITDNQYSGYPVYTFTSSAKMSASKHMQGKMYLEGVQFGMNHL
jgi:hypothetical protein